MRGDELEYYNSSQMPLFFFLACEIDDEMISGNDLIGSTLSDGQWEKSELIVCRLTNLKRDKTKIEIEEKSFTQNY